MILPVAHTIGLVDKNSARAVFAKNLRTLMDRSADLKTQAAVGKRAGMSQRAISNLLRPDAPDLDSPTLATVERVAHAFGIATWQILIDPKTVSEDLASLLMRPAVLDEDPRLANPRWDASSKRVGRPAKVRS